jgi:SHS2 domain-containing protein
VKTYEILDHTADIGIACYGADLMQLFSNAALGLYSLIIDIDNIKEELQREISLSSQDKEGLLVDWLNELIYVFDVEHVIFKRCEFSRLNDNTLQARCFGDKINPEHQTVKREVKAATYHMLEIKSKKDGYEARVIFDI